MDIKREKLFSIFLSSQSSIIISYSLSNIKYLAVLNRIGCKLQNTVRIIHNSKYSMLSEMEQILSVSDFDMAI